MGMKKNQIIGLLLLILAMLTVMGMVIKSEAYWSVHNYLAILISLIGGIFLLKQK